MINVLHQSINQHVEITKEEVANMLPYFNVIPVKKKQILLSPGDTVVPKFFVISGSIRQYLVTDSGIEHTIIFSLEGWWLTDLGSFLEDQQGKYYIEAMEDGEVAAISKANFDQLFEDFPALNIYFRKLYQKAVMAKDTRILNMLSNKAEDRFLQFAEKYPTLMQRIPQYIIASYLGVTPEFFSRMKSKLSQTKP